MSQARSTDRTVIETEQATLEGQMIFLDCPAYLDEDGAERCGLPAEVCDRLTTCSTGGPIESVRIRCPSGHWFNAPIEFLIWHTDPRIEHAAAPGRAGPW